MARRVRPLRIAVVDDHVREKALLERLFSTVRDMALVAFETTHGALLDRWSHVRPDVVLVDVRRQPPPGQLSEEIRPWDEFRAIADKGVPTFAISVSQEARDILAAGRAGAIGYLRKHDEADIVDRIRLIAKGETPDPTFAEAMAYLTEVTDLKQRLTPREFDVIQLMVEGLHPPEIAADWKINPTTVNGYVDNIRRKLGLRGYGQIGAWAARNGFA